MSDHRGHCHANRLARQCEKKKQNEAILVFMSFKGFGRVLGKRASPFKSSPGNQWEEQSVLSGLLSWP